MLGRVGETAIRASGNCCCPGAIIDWVGSHSVCQSAVLGMASTAYRRAFCGAPPAATIESSVFIIYVKKLFLLLKHTHSKHKEDFFVAKTTTG